MPQVQARSTSRWLAVAERDLKAVRNNLHGPESTTEVADLPLLTSGGEGGNP